VYLSIRQSFVYVIIKAINPFQVYAGKRKFLSVCVLLSMIGVIVFEPLGYADKFNFYTFGHTFLRM
jgi:hypothetical protein